MLSVLGKKSLLLCVAIIHFVFIIILEVSLNGTQYEIDYINDLNDGLEVVLIAGWEKDEDSE